MSCSCCTRCTIAAAVGVLRPRTAPPPSSPQDRNHNEESAGTAEGMARADCGVAEEAGPVVGIPAESTGHAAALADQSSEGSTVVPCTEEVAAGSHRTCAVAVEAEGVMTSRLVVLLEAEVAAGPTWGRTDVVDTAPTLSTLTEDSTALPRQSVVPELSIWPGLNGSPTRQVSNTEATAW